LRSAGKRRRTRSCPDRVGDPTALDSHPSSNAPGTVHVGSKLDVGRIRIVDGMETSIQARLRAVDGSPPSEGLRPRVETADVVIVGARCAGAPTAMLLARCGHDVVIVDRAQFPSDTLSTHAIARGGVVQLQRWGILDWLLASGAPQLRRADFHVDGEIVTRAVKDRYGVDFVVAPRRHVLDPLLQQAAMSAGARLRTGISVADVTFDEAGRAVGISGRDAHGTLEIHARLVVGADGLKSRVARSVAAAVVEERPSHSALHYRYVRGDWPAIEYHLSDCGYAGVFPTHDGDACVWVSQHRATALTHRRIAADLDRAFDSMLDSVAPGLQQRLRSGTAASPVRGMLNMPNQLRAPVGPGWMLVGDAGYHRDAITGQGITDAFRDAELAAEAIDAALRDPSAEQAAFEHFHAERDRMLRDVFQITCELSRLPGRDRFIELQKQLAEAIDAQAAELAQRPIPAALAA
jgi:flavin-dependent dehydrogenase